MGLSLSLIESTLDLPHVPGRTQLSLMIPINQRFDPSSSDAAVRCQIQDLAPSSPEAPIRASE